MKQPSRVMILGVLLLGAPLLLLVPRAQPQSTLASFLAQGTEDLRERPEVLQGGEVGVGRLVSDLELTPLGGTSIRLSQLEGPEGTLIAIRDLGCPVSRRYAPRLERLAGKLLEEGWNVVFVFPNPIDTADRIQAAVGDLKGVQWVADGEGEISGRLDAKTTTEVFLIDSARTLRYRGAIDDQYGIGYTKPAPTQEYLKWALAEISSNSTLSTEATTAPGCYLESSPTSTTIQQLPITYHNRISRVIQRNCEGCHREGGPGPFSLSSYREVFGYRSMISHVVDKGLMPPWFASEEVGEWVNQRGLAVGEKKDLLAWLAGDSPRGDSSDAPLPFQYATGWQIGEPDAILEIPEEMPIPAEGIMDYQYVYVQTDFAEDRWIQDMQVRPTALIATHHVLVFIEEPGRRPGRRRSRQRPFQSGVRSYFASWVPGQQPNSFPKGMAKLLPAGAWLKFQVHYTPNGQATSDRTKIGFVFADQPPVTEVLTSSALQGRFEIPPGAENHEVVGEHRFRESGYLLSFFPHMHLRGKAFRYELVLPEGVTRRILEVPRYDFNWQLNYELREPLFVPAGARLRATAWYDNSRNNPANPDPSKAVRWGDQSFEEMMIGYFNWHKTQP